MTIFSSENNFGNAGNRAGGNIAQWDCTSNTNRVDVQLLHLKPWAPRTTLPEFFLTYQLVLRAEK